MSYYDLPYEIDSRCLHQHVKVVTQGVRNFDAGEVWDDLKDIYVCLDCSRILNEVEVRELSMGRNTRLKTPLRSKYHGHR